jgi:hypothetical protein
MLFPKLKSWDRPKAMSLAIVCCILYLPGCSPTPQVPVEELRLTAFSAWGESETAELRRNGESRFRVHDSNYPIHSRNSRLPMSTERFDSIVNALRPYRAQAKAVSTMTVDDVVNAGCAVGEPHTTDHGGLHIEWKAGSESYVTSVYFDCDPEHNAVRFEQLRRLFQGLRVPQTHVDGDSHQ